MKRSLLRITAALALGYLLLLTALYLLQNTMIYYPARAAETEMLALAGRLKVEPWRDPQGAIIGWRRPNPAAANKALVFHGNAGHALHRTHFIDALQALDGGKVWEVFVFEYPGYGARSGAPSEKSIVEGAHSAAQMLADQDARPLYAVGESLGSGAACALAREAPELISGLALVTPYSSILEVAAHHYPFIPARWILRDRFDNIGSLEKYRGPVGFVVAGDDEVVTAASGLRLHELYAGPKHLRLYPNVRHNELDYSIDAEWWREISDFITGPR